MNGGNALKILILGADGYLGWPTCMNFAAAGHEVYAVDNYMRRIISEATASEALYSTPNLSERVRVFKDLSGKVISNSYLASILISLIKSSRHGGALPMIKQNQNLFIRSFSYCYLLYYDTFFINFMSLN